MTQQVAGYIIALTGGFEDPSFEHYSTWDSLTNSDTYKSIHDFVNDETGERADIIAINIDGTLSAVEEFTEN